MIFNIYAVKRYTKNTNRIAKDAIYVLVLHFNINKIITYLNVNLKLHKLLNAKDLTIGRFFKYKVSFQEKV